VCWVTTSGGTERVSGPLSGLKVIELAGIGPGPFACMLLADAGADVLRLERGDANAEAATSTDLLNRSRPSVAVDLKNPAGRELVLELGRQADVLVEGFRPGVTERLGLGPKEFWERNRRLVYARMTGYGQSGPLADRAGHDVNYLSISGALWPLGRAGERPTPPLNLVADFGGGSMFLIFGIMSALYAVQRSGEGQVVDAAMVDGTASMLSMLHSMMNGGFWSEERGVNLLDTGAHFYEVYETSDARYVAVGAIEPKFYRELLDGLGLLNEALPDQGDRSQWPAMKERFAAIFRTKTRDEWTIIFEARDACVTPVLSPREAVTHPYNVARDVYVNGDAPQPSPAPRFSSTPSSIGAPPLAAGSGTRDGLAAWGIGGVQFEELRTAGAFG
jgi:alpha-methylacyl-CoA racemase